MRTSISVTRLMGGAAALLSVSTPVAALFGRGANGKDFEYDYCSTGHSLQVYEDTANYFNEVFGGYNVPMDPYTCPFHANNLTYLRDSKQLQNWRSAKAGSGGKITCPISSKVFKTQEFYELHLKTQYMGSDMRNYRYSLGQENRLTGLSNIEVSN